MELKQAYQKDEVLLSDILRATAQADSLHCWWLGQSGFLIQYQGKHLLLDPYLSDTLTLKYANTDKPHVRMTERVISPDLLTFIDVVSSSHNHTDHLDAATLLPIIRSNPSVRLVIPEANRAFVSERLGLEDPAFPIGLNAGEEVDFPPFRIQAIPAAHNELETDSQGRHVYLGYIVYAGPYCMYHSGDTLWYEGLENHFKNIVPDLAFLPINGNKPERRVAGNLDAREAAQLGKTIQAHCVIPCHYDMFAFNTADPSVFEDEAKKIAQGYKVLRCGEKYTISK